MGALEVLVAVQVSALGLYLPPVFRLPCELTPPQIIISTPVHTEGRDLTCVGSVEKSSSSPGVIDAVRWRRDFRKLVGGVIEIRCDTNAFLCRGSRAGCKRIPRRSRHAWHQTKISTESLS